MKIQQIINWRDNLTTKNLLKDYVDTLFVLVFVMAYITMIYNSDSCILINSHYSPAPYNFSINADVIGSFNRTSSFNLSNIPDYSSDRLFFKSVSDRQQKAINLNYNIFVFVLPIVSLWYLIFWFLIVRNNLKKEKIKETEKYI